MYNNDLIKSNSLISLVNTPSLLIMRGGRYVDSVSGVPFTGYFTSYFPDSRLKESEGRMSNGYMNDVWAFYYPNGNLKSEAEFEKGRCIRTLLSFYENGTKESEFDEDSQVYTTWHPNGKLKSFIQYLDGMKEGSSKEWYEDGQLKSEYQYYHHHEHGICKEYYRGGGLSLVSVYQNGRKNGFWQGFYPDGKLKFEGRYSDGKKTGKWKECDSVGKMSVYQYR